MHALCAYVCVLTRTCSCSFLSLCVDARVHASFVRAQMSMWANGHVCASTQACAHAYQGARARTHRRLSMWFTIFCVCLYQPLCVHIRASGFSCKYRQTDVYMSRAEQIRFLWCVIQPAYMPLFDDVISYACVRGHTHVCVHAQTCVRTHAGLRTCVVTRASTHTGACTCSRLDGVKTHVPLCIFLC